MFSPSDFFNFSKELTGFRSNHQLAKERTILSRIYYSAFLSAREYLFSILPPSEKRIIRKGIIEKDGVELRINVHALVIETFSLSENPVHSKIGSILEELRSARNKADYVIAFIPVEISAFMFKADYVVSLFSGKNIPEPNKLLKAFSKAIKKLS